MRKFSIKVNGQPYEVEVEEINAADMTFTAAEAPIAPPAAVIRPVAAPAVDVKGTQLKAPMPGVVVGHKAENGAKVSKGQAVLVLEAMKMENEIAAPVDGIITYVAAKGANVNSGDVLAVIA